MRSIKRNLPVWICVCCLLMVCWGPIKNVFASTIGKPGGGNYQTVQDEAADLPQEPKLNFAGGGVSCVDNAGVSTDCTITGLAATAYDTVQDQGVNLTQRTTLDFEGAGVTCADSGGTKSLCTIPGGGGFYQTLQDEGAPLTQRAIFDFAGAGVTCVDSGGTKSLCTIPGGGAALLDLAKMTRNAAQSIPGGAVDTKILFDTITFDQGTSITADATTNDRFDINADGWYLVGCSWGTTDLSDVAPATASIYVNGAIVRVDEIRSSNSLGDYTPGVKDLLELSNGDFVEFYVAQADSGGAMNTDTTAERRPSMFVSRLR